MSSYYNRVLQESTLFELFKSEAYTDTEKALRVASASISDKLLSVKDGSWSQKRLKSVQASVGEEITKAYGGLFESLNEELKDVSSIVVSNMDTKVPISSLDELLKPDRLVQGYEAKKLFKVTQDNHARQLNVLIASGVSQGKPAASIVRDLTLKNTKLTKGQLRNAVFTTVTEARAATRHEAFKALERSGVVEGYEYVATLDSSTTEYCRNHDNKRYRKSISEISHMINVHWHCRSVFVPFTKTTNVASRASQFGPVPNESYGKWFSKQDKDFQKLALGNSKFKDYIAGAYTVTGISSIVGPAVSSEAAATQLASVFNPYHYAKDDGDLGEAIYNRSIAPKIIDPKLDDLFTAHKENNKASEIFKGIEVTKSSIYEDAKVGDIVFDNYPTSWSSSASVGEHFTMVHMKERSNDSIFVRMISAEGVGYEVSKLSDKPAESEVLVKPAQKLKVVSRTTKKLKDNTKRTTITVIPQ